MPLALIIGCSQPKAQVTGTGARDAALQFARAIVAKDWDRAFSLTHPDSRLSAGQFATLAHQYRSQFRFEPTSVQITACEEHSDTALAHLVYAGRSSHQRFKETLVLKPLQDGWGVVLPSTFGRRRLP